MERDPHDALLLSKRPTTVVTEATRMFDRMPAPYGASEDEESLFAGVGADDGAAAYASALEASKAKLLAALPGVAPAGNSRVAVAQPTSGIPKVAMIAGAAALAYFLFFRK